MGQQSDVPKEGKWQAEDLPRPQGPKQGHHSREPQGSNPRGDSPCPHGSHQVFKGQQQQGLLWHAFNGGSVTPDNVQYASRKVQVLTCPLWTENVPRHFPNVDG